MQEVPFSIMDENQWGDAKEKIDTVRKIFEEENLLDDPELMNAINEVVDETFSSEK